MRQKKYFYTSIIVMFLSIQTSFGQLPSLDFIYGYTSDAKLLLQEYMRPYANIMGANLNAGWYNTAEVHKLGGFDLTATVSVAFAPPSALAYDLSAIPGLIATIDGASTVAPTVAGESETLPTLQYTADIVDPVTQTTQTFPLANIQHPNGGGLNFLPLPMAQVTIGLIKGTDISIRYMPKIDIGDFGNIGVWGVGGKHLISQWIPVLKRLKFINIAVQGGYTNISTMTRLSMEPNVDVEPVDAPSQWIDQKFNLNAAGWTVNLIASQSLPIITVYEGIGYSNSLVDMSLLGHYPIYTLVDEVGANFGSTTYRVAEDPIDNLSWENYKNLRLNAGIRLKLGMITVHYDFTKTLYATHTAGIGVSFR